MFLYHKKLSFITLFLVPKLSFIERSNGIWKKSFKIEEQVLELKKKYPIKSKMKFAKF